MGTLGIDYNLFCYFECENSYAPAITTTVLGPDCDIWPPICYVRDRGRESSRRRSSRRDKCTHGSAQVEVRRKVIFAILRRGRMTSHR